MKKDIILGFGITCILFSLIFVSSFTNDTKEDCIQFTNVQGSYLYKDCGNELSITENIDDISVTGATKIKGVKRGQFYIFPNADKVTIKAKRRGVAVSSIEYKTKAVPIPSITLKKDEGRDINQKRGERINTIGNIKIAAICTDQHFLSNYPKDTLYTVSKYEVRLIRGTEVIKKIESDKSTFDVTSLGTQKPNDRILIIIKAIKRKNFQNKTFIVPTKDLVYNIPLSD